MRLHMPATYPSGNCLLVPLDSVFAPIIVSRYLPLLESRLWYPEDYQAGYRAISWVIAQMTVCSVADLIQEIRDFRGVKPEYASIDVVDRTSDMYNSLNDLFYQLLQLRGLMSDGWFEDTYATLKDVIQAQRGTVQETGESIWDDIAQLISTGASIDSILAHITSLLTSQETVAVEGGLLLTLVGLTAANSGLLGQHAAGQQVIYNQLVEILKALRGETSPADNILLALRGSTDADATRNVVTQLE